MCYLFYISLPHLKRIRPQVPTIWRIRRMVLIHINNIKGRRNIHVWWKSNYKSIVVDLLCNLEWSIFLVLQLIVGTNRKPFLSKSLTLKIFLRLFLSPASLYLALVASSFCLTSSCIAWIWSAIFSAAWLTPRNSSKGTKSKACLGGHVVDNNKWRLTSASANWVVVSKLCLGQSKIPLLGLLS